MEVCSYPACHAELVEGALTDTPGNYTLPFYSSSEDGSL